MSFIIRTAFQPNLFPVFRSVGTLPCTAGFRIFVWHHSPLISEGINRGEWLVVDETTQAADLLPLAVSVA